MKVLCLSQLLGHLLQVAKQVAGSEELKDGYRIGKVTLLELDDYPLPKT